MRESNFANGIAGSNEWYTYNTSIAKLYFCRRASILKIYFLKTIAPVQTSSCDLLFPFERVRPLLQRTMEWKQAVNKHTKF